MSHGYTRKRQRRQEAAKRCIENKYGQNVRIPQQKRTFSIIIPKREVKHTIEVKTLKTFCP